MEKFTKEQLKAYGIFSDEQIEAIVRQSEENANLDSEKISMEEPKTEHREPYTSNDVTTIGQLNEYAKGNVVRLPDFSEGQPFIVVLRRPSLLCMMKSGKIPNKLINTASALFEGKSSDISSDTSAMADMLDVMEIIAEASLVQPTMAEIKEAGVQLTDEQLVAIFNYSQSGIEGLQSFRK